MNNEERTYQEAQSVFWVLALMILAIFVHIMLILFKESFGCPKELDHSLFLATVAQILGGIFAIVFTVSALALTIASDRYTPFLLKLYAHDKVIRQTTSMFLFGIIYMLVALSIEPFRLYGISLVAAFSIIAACLFLLMRLFRHTISYLNPTELISQIERDVVKLSYTSEDFVLRLQAIADVAVKASMRNEPRVSLESVEALRRIGESQSKTADEDSQLLDGFAKVQEQHLRLIEIALLNGQVDILDESFKVINFYLDQSACEGSLKYFMHVLDFCFQGYTMFLDKKSLYRLSLIGIMIECLRELSVDFQENEEKIVLMYLCLKEINQASHLADDDEGWSKFIYDLYDAFSIIFLSMNRGETSDDSAANKLIIEHSYALLQADQDHFEKMIVHDAKLIRDVFKEFLLIFQYLYDKSTKRNVFLDALVRMLVDINQQILKASLDELWVLQLKQLSHLDSRSHLLYLLPRGLRFIESDYTRHLTTNGFHQDADPAEFVREFKTILREIESRHQQDLFLELFDLKRILEPVPNKISVELYKRELEKQHGLIHSNLSAEFADYFRVVTKQIDATLQKLELHTTIFEAFFYIGSLATYYERYDYIEKMWRYANPHDADAIWIGITNLIEFDVSVLTQQMLLRMDRSRTIEGTHGSSTYVARYYLMAMAYALNHTKRNKSVYRPIPSPDQTSTAV